MAMANNERYRLLGGPGSPFSLKMRAALRYRHIPHAWVVPQGYLADSPELKAAAKGIIPVMQIPEGDYWADTTPMILALETRHPEARSLLPDNPTDRFLSLLIEDFADEWLVLPFFDYRWDSEIDQAFCSRRQMAGWLGAMPAAQFDDIVAKFRQRQTGVLSKMGDRELNRPLLRSTYPEVLEAVEAQLEVSRYFFGGRPSIGDIGLYAQLFQCAIDPTASGIMRSQAVRTFQWVHDLDDASGIEGEWRDPASPLGAGVEKLLLLIGEIYLPYLIANAAAVIAEEGSVSIQVRDMPFVARTNPYKARCLGALKVALADAIDAGAPDLEAILKRFSCWDSLQLAPGERQTITPILPTDTGKRAAVG